MIDKFNNKVCKGRDTKGLFLTGMSDYKGYFNALDGVVKPVDGNTTYTTAYNEFRKFTKMYCENIRQTCTILDFMVKVFEKQKKKRISYNSLLLMQIYPW